MFKIFIISNEIGNFFWNSKFSKENLNIYFKIRKISIKLKFYLKIERLYYLNWNSTIMFQILKIQIETRNMKFSNLNWTFQTTPRKQ